MCLVQLQAAGPGSVWGLISNNVEEEDYNYCADGEDLDEEDLNYFMRILWSLNSIFSALCL